jgi:hypothetical protein
MKQLTVLFALLLAGVAHADSNGLCKPLCETEKRECRRHAASIADDEKLPLLAMEDRNPNARVSRGMADKPSDAQVRQGYESRRVREQRTCDTRYVRCVQACARPDAPKQDAQKHEAQKQEAPTQPAPAPRLN